MSLTDLFSQNHKKLTMDEPVASILDNTASQLVGKPIDRIDGKLKVTGQAHYTADYNLPERCYGVMVGATVGKGKVKKIHTHTATDIKGVIAVLHDELFLRNPQQGGMTFAPKQGATEVFYHGQPVALVVGETLEAAQQGAWALQIDYDNDERHGRFDFEKQKSHNEYINWVSDKNLEQGKPEKTLAAAQVSVDATYTTPSQSNMPMEMHASLAYWQGDELTVHTSNQMLAQSKTQLAKSLNISEDKVRLLSPYVGGGFGSKLGIAPESVMAALAAKQLERPVLVMMTRPQVMETTVRRSNTEQRIALGADADGKIHTIIHNSLVTNLPSELFFEPVAVSTHFLYAGENRQINYRMVRMNQVLAGSMRAPGEAVGQLGLECAMDELAYKLGICPIELRKRNEPKQDPSQDIPYSTRHLVACMEQGAKAFGWQKRLPTPAITRDGDWLVGYGMAAAARSNELKPAQAQACLTIDPQTDEVTATIETDMTDIGTGSYTIFAQIAADMLGLPLDNITVKLGDTNLPASSGSGGSWGASSTGSAVYMACQALQEKIAELADIYPDTLRLQDAWVYQQGEHEPSLGEAVVEQGKDWLKSLFIPSTANDAAAPDTDTTDVQPATNQPNIQQRQAVISLHELLKQHAPDGLQARGEIKPGKTKKQYRHAGFGAQFAEVGVHRVTGEIRVRRMLGVFAAGRILNEKTARSQCYGGMVFGIGAALMEKINHDTGTGRLCNHDFAEYHVPVNADVPELEVIFLPEADPYANPLHSKGVGELALAGAGAAIANAVFNATGIRIRDYPITPDKLLYQLPLLP